MARGAGVFRRSRGTGFCAARSPSPAAIRRCWNRRSNRGGCIAAVAAIATGTIGRRCTTAAAIAERTESSNRPAYIRPKRATYAARLAHCPIAATARAATGTAEVSRPVWRETPAARICRTKILTVVGEAAALGVGALPSPNAATHPGMGRRSSTETAVATNEPDLVANDRVAAAKARPTGYAPGRPCVNIGAVDPVETTSATRANGYGERPACCNRNKYVVAGFASATSRRRLAVGNTAFLRNPTPAPTCNAACNNARHASRYVEGVTARCCVFLRMLRHVPT